MGRWRCLALGIILAGWASAAARGVPDLLGLVLSPFAAVVLLLAGGLVSVVWFLALLFQISLIGENEEHPWAVVRATLMAFVLGLTPQALFLMVLNTVGADRPDWGRRVSAYESFVGGLNDRLGPYLLPSMAAGIVLSLTLLILPERLRRPGLFHLGVKIRNGARFLGLTLTAATSFTLCTAVPTGHWQPDSRVIVATRLRDAARAEAELALSRVLAEELPRPGSEFAPGAAALVRRFGMASADEKEVVLREVSRRPAWSDGFEFFLSCCTSEAAERLSATLAVLSRTEARAQVGPLNQRIAETTGQASAVRAEVAGTLGSLAGNLGGAFTHDLVAALVEDAVTRLADEALRRSAAAHNASRILAEALTGSWAFSSPAIVLSPMLRRISESAMLRQLIDVVARHRADVRQAEERARVDRARSRARGR